MMDPQTLLNWLSEPGVITRWKWLMVQVSAGLLMAWHLWVMLYARRLRQHNEQLKLALTFCEPPRRQKGSQRLAIDDRMDPPE